MSAVGAGLDSNRLWKTKRAEGLDSERVWTLEDSEHACAPHTHTTNTTADRRGHSPIGGCQDKKEANSINGCWGNVDVVHGMISNGQWVVGIMSHTMISAR